jgi:hypothetical protein
MMVRHTLLFCKLNLPKSLSCSSDVENGNAPA